ncbi:MAG TPA: ATP-binding protein, partial [Polyangiaceae bacterium]|nr:ATP-binding protein [Polyangiaceae bacterium]
AAAHATGVMVMAHASGHGAAVACDRAAWFGLVAALPMAVHVAIAYAGDPPSRSALVALYGVAAGWALLDIFALPHFVGSVGGASRGAPLGSFSIATYCASVVASVGTIVVVARAYLAGRRDALAVVMGATVLLATAVNDLGVASGALSTALLIDAGLAAFVGSIMSTRSARFVALTVDLDRRTRELRIRTGELRRSYEELRAAQEELVKKEQLAVVGELAAVIAHEVRNPLAIIANAVSGLRKQAISRQDHETLLAILEEETSRLNRLVTDLLRYARPVSIQRSDFSLPDVLERALTLVSQDRKGIKTDLKVNGCDGRIWGDSNLLRQVFDNLVVNAVQAMGAGGSLTVCVRAATENEVDGVAVDIIDTGEGMDTQVRTRARDPFFTTRPSGTGLGLAIVDRIVDAHGGYLAIDSRTGEGTTVTVFLPTGSPNEPAQPRSRSSKTPSEASGPVGAAR